MFIHVENTLSIGSQSFCKLNGTVFYLCMSRDDDRILREQKEQFEREQKALQSRYEEREAKQEAGFQAQRQEQETLKRALLTASANVDLYVQLAEKEAETLSMKEKLRVIREENRKILEKLHGES